ncbi:Ltp family lipoprotein [Nocardia camponoti]|uniref:Putative host cell surface-exposed lipoprotein Ltp-like HTH region domain-containing protein n=1 Tax=Nocardia camponoti TaxID=1616106 RepID=A0A917QB52_9NOCA|nr:Ltp family lipoprotein [Nocardia camponoti]GGK40472.1 hypothetical protein GCM10011591_10120 [Nocardia camponoti]
MTKHTQFTKKWSLSIGASVVALAVVAPVWSGAVATADVAVPSAGAPTFEFASPAREQTSSQRNAIQKAKSYLELTSFSRTSLIAQLEYEGFSTADSTFAVDSLDTDWNEQAAKKAKSYLELTAFSRSGLLAQLKYEGFTQQQAEYGVNAAY